MARQAGNYVDFNSKIIKNKIQELRNNGIWDGTMKLSQKMTEFGTDISYKTIDSWLGKNPPKTILEDYAKALSNILDIDYKEIINENNDIEENFYFIRALSICAGAGEAIHIDDIDIYESENLLPVAKELISNYTKNLRAIQVDGDSMLPEITNGSWAFFEKGSGYVGDGLYVLNYCNQLMIKRLQLNPVTKTIYILSSNPKYKSFEVSLEEAQNIFLIIGRVRCTMMMN